MGERWLPGRPGGGGGGGGGAALAPPTPARDLSAAYGKGASKYPETVLTEWKERKVAECALDEAKRHGYRWGRPWGLDRNVLLWT